MATTLKVKQQKYAFTLKDNRRDQSDYKHVFDDWEKRGVVVNCKYAESNCNYSILHYHGIISIPVTLYRKTLCPKGYHLLIKPLYNEEGWLEYCRKQQDDEVSQDTNDNLLFNLLRRKLF